MEAADGHSADPVKADDMAGMGGTDRKLLLDVLHQVLVLAEMSGQPKTRCGPGLAISSSHALLSSIIPSELS